ncbi:MAG: hypothetical protein J5781_03440 [Clostridia bacterium]|nr:hypothetical protein [Clostridia bacterium]
MLYEKSKGVIGEELFKNPPCEFRGAPFWAWNGKLDKDEVVWQAGVFKEMGFGGYHIHVRTGLEDEYLGEKFNECVKACAEDAEKTQMLAWLYDEDRWPSGFAGGFVTKDKAFRQRYLQFQRKKDKSKPVYNEEGVLIGGSKLLACYKICVSFGKLVSYKRVKEDDPSANAFAYLKLAVDDTIKSDSWFNNTSYVDTLNKKALDKFAEITYGNYKKKIPEYLGNVCPAIFTDEPQFYYSGNPHKRAWTDDFAETYKKTYGEDILDKLPELFYKVKKGYSPVRYRYWDHVTERFANAFADNLGEKAEEVGLKMTGHMMLEGDLQGQTKAIGEAMRHYRGFGLPGIDMLCSRYEFNTAKQCQSVVCQYGKEGMLSELYGVSRWNYDFRKYKIHGDWQAALGVTIRVPHLSMYSMKGEAKRDYPASIFYQSPWYKKHNVVEDHFARVNTALTGGKQICDIAVIHPIESMWMLTGNVVGDSKKRIQMDLRFAKLTEMLLKNGLDFHFIDESLLPEQCKKGGNPLQVGQMAYKVVVVPECITLRKTTVKRLEEFKKQGGKVIFIGAAPAYMDAEPSDEPKKLYDACERIPFDKEKIFAELEDFRRVGFYDKATGKHTDNIIYSLKEKADGEWLFLSRAGKERFPDPDKISRQELKIVIDGEWTVSLWNTLDGNVYGVPFEAKDGKTTVEADMWDQDSLLFRLEKGPQKEYPRLASKNESKKVSVENNVPFTLSEPNVVLLDRAYYAVDDKPYSKWQMEVLLFDNFCRRKAGLEWHAGGICQPWAAGKKPATHKIRMKFIVFSEIEYEGASLALEDAALAEITFNGQKVDKKIEGWYVDKAIEKVKMPTVRKGKNVIEIVLPFGENTFTEWCYLLGDFGVKVCGTKKTIVPMPKTIGFGSIVKQGFPFYGGELTYHTSFIGNGKEGVLSVPSFRSAVLEADCCGRKVDIAYAPYTAEIGSKDGKTPLDITAYISRQNAFGCIHHPGMWTRNFCVGPNNYRTCSPFDRVKRYVLLDEGILSAPIVGLSE